ncbi:MAG: YihY family inner membrane protein [Alcaligenaceae bacterium]|nr:YihY family inner membrane protein [Alcaligenaceae bacterium]
MSLLDNKAPSDKDNFDNDEVFIKNYRDSIFDWRFYKDVLMFAITRLINEGLTNKAASLSYTSITSSVPLLAVILSLFTAFPIFNDFKIYLEQFLSQSLFPENISEQLLGYLNTFAEAATSLTAIGTIFLFVTSILLMMTIEDSLNQIFQVRKPRSLLQRILVYWAVLSIGPFALALSLWASATAVQQTVLGEFSLVQRTTSFLLPMMFTGLLVSLLYYIVPNRRIKFRDALVGGFFMAIISGLMRSGFTLYLSKFPTYTLIYGTFAVLPIFLIWVYMSWLIVLLGAYIVSLMPQIRRGLIAQNHRSGTRFLLAIKILRVLHNQRLLQQPSVTESQFESLIHTSQFNLIHVLYMLSDLGYVMRGSESKDAVWALVCDDSSSIQPLIDEFLFDKNMLHVLNDEKIRVALERTFAKEDVTIAEIY